ncbi:efflux RND transporter periplasmic adaptor subunit [Carboxylicivirga caseinilyticus]|uniref:efflux RND transporter periplasmic adaptor subunit n=1 Tax=Carboxylicivirga caseinilyticus TaxID=3417572 RepID=UPI003D33151F|nr:efflux RND transporter periplasmic adaptor subunit [Marinilabiliaceae bacterium A049]
MKKILQYIKSNYKAVLITLLAGLLIGWMIKPSHSEETQQHQHNHAEESTTWTCSMHPQIKQEEPGSCPICGMDLIPLKSMQGSDDANPDEVAMSEAAIKLADIQTVKVVKKQAIRKEYLQGKIEPDERKIAQLTARFSGRIEKLNINFTGQNVRKGQALATIYSPELVSAQRELIEAAALKETNPALYKAAKAKLSAWDLTPQQISEIENASDPIIHFNILSPVSGTVTSRNVAQGDYVKEGTDMFQITDLSKVWIQLDAYETDLPWITQGDKISFSAKSQPGKTFEANVSFIDPILNPQTRVAKVRAEVINTNGNLKPGMFVTAYVESKLSIDDALIIPKSAVLWTGKRAVAYVKVEEREQPTFLYREIVLGPEADDSYVVADGLEEGEVIAANGVFKIDAAAQLEGKQSMMNSSKSDMHHMDMSMKMKKDSFQVAGNCGMCKETIETAAKGVKGVHFAEWNKHTKTFKVNYMVNETDLTTIHKAIASAGYDTKLEKATQESYDNLHSCCKYDRNDFGESATRNETYTFKVFGNCGMCKDRIEEAASKVEGVNSAEWNEETKMISIEGIPSLNIHTVHKAIAAVGHDTEIAKAPDSVYNKLPECCLYDRP